MGSVFKNLIIMKVFTLHILCLILLSFNSAQSERKVKKYSVAGVITGTSNYCGGARPSDEMLADIATPKPIPNKKIYIKKGEINSFKNKILLTLITDSAGKFQAKLPPGKYLIVDGDKKDMTYYNQLLKEHKEQTKNFDAVDSTCLNEWYLKPDFTFEVKHTEIKNISVNYHKACFNLPCIQFRGPYPP